jgi:hypothetical protein
MLIPLLDETLLGLRLNGPGSHTPRRLAELVLRIKMRDTLLPNEQMKQCVSPTLRRFPSEDADMRSERSD